MKKQCLNCNKEFDAKRADAKYCSNNCRAHDSNKKKKNPMTNPAAAPITNSTPVFMGLGNPDTGYMARRLQELENENTTLRERVKNYEVEEKVRLSIEEKGSGKGFLGDALESLKDKEIRETIKDFLPFFRSNKNLPENAGTTDILAGLEQEKRDKIHAAVELLKPMPDELIDVFLGIVGKASEDPEGFMQGIKENFKEPAGGNNGKMWMP